jgi:DNA-directed RNA polymerase subunit RPC12/RpoP
MQRVFWATCPTCDHKLMVDWNIRHAGVPLECPSCRGKFLADDAKALDERWS